MFDKQKVFNSSILFLVLILEFLIFVYLFSNSFISVDDVDLRCNSLKDIFISPTLGLFPSSILGKLFGVFIPYTLNMHPSFFMSNCFCYIEAVIVLFFIFILNNVLFINKKLNFFYIISFVFLSSFLLFVSQERAHLFLYVYEGFFRMLMPSFVFVLLFYTNLKNINENSISKNLSLFLLTFLSCIWNELICITVTIGSILFFLFSIKEIKSEKNFIIRFLPIIISLCSCFLLIKMEVFVRHSENPINLEHIIQTIKLIPDFSIKYIYHIFFKHIFMYIILFSQIAILIFKFKENENVRETIKIIICYLFGILTFFFMLIGLGKTHYIEGEYWIVHYDLHAIYNIVLCSFNLALLNLVIRYNLIKELFIGIMLFISSIYFIKSDYIFYKDIIKNMLNPRAIEVYKAEKIMRLASYKQKIIYLDKKLLEEPGNWALFPHFFGTEENVLYTESPYIIYLNQFENENKINQSYMFTDIETVENEFRKNGGVFTEEELENIDFNRLRDKNFVLNNKI